MRPEQRLRALPRRFAEQLLGQLAVGVVDVPFPWKGELGRLIVGPFHQPDRGRNRQQALDIFGRPAEIRLQADPDVRPFALGAAVYLESRVDVARLLHVDPEHRARLIGPRGELQHVLHAAFRARVQPEMRQLDRDVRRQLAALNLFVHAEVMIAYLGGFGAVRDLLTELGEDRAESRLRELAGCFECRIECLTRHEAFDGALEKTALAQLAREPLAARGLEEQ